MQMGGSEVQSRAGGTTLGCPSFLPPPVLSKAGWDTCNGGTLSSPPFWQLSPGAKGQAAEVPGAGFHQQQHAGYLTSVTVKYDSSSSSCLPPGEIRFLIQTCNCCLEVKAVVCSGLVLLQPAFLL